jgi:uncharacterized protein (TIGR02271 family)
MSTIEDIKTWRGETLVDTEGSKIGSIEEVYVDTDSGEPEWLAVKTGLFGSKLSFVPLADADRTDDAVRVPYDKAQVKDAPQIDADGALSEAEEAELYRHYGLQYDAGASAGPRSRGGNGSDRELAVDDADRTRTGGPGRDTSGPNTDDAMTRSEEELNVGTRQRESGRARLRKYVVTEEVQRTVPVQREEVRIEREPITDANRDAATSGADLSEEEHEMTLHEEDVVVDKQVVPKERVRLDKDVSTEQREVSEEVRKERIDTEGASER